MIENDISIAIDPKIRAQLSEHYNSWERFRAAGRGETPMKTCLKCRKKFNSRRTTVYMRQYWCRSIERVLVEYMCGPCLGKREFRTVKKSEFKPVVT